MERSARTPQMGVFARHAIGAAERVGVEDPVGTGERDVSDGTGEDKDEAKTKEDSGPPPDEDAKRVSGRSGRLYSGHTLGGYCIQIVGFPRSEASIALSILANVATMARQSPLDPPSTQKATIIDVCERVFRGRLTTELGLWMVTVSLLGHRQTYLSECHGVTHRRSLHKTALTAVETERVELNNKSGVAEATALKLPTLKNRAMVDTYAVRTRPRLPQTRRRLRLSPFMFTFPLPSRFRAVFAGGGRGGWQRAAHQPQHGSQVNLVRSPPPSPPLHELRGQWRLQIRREELLLVRHRVLRHLRAPGPPPHPHRWLPSGIGEG